MITNPVESSMIARVGYDPESRHLRVVMRQGAIFEATATPEECAAFMAAPSKGTHWRQVFMGRSSRLGQAVTEPVIPLREPARPLDTFDPDPCCGKHLAKALHALASVTSWHCPACGEEWRPDQIDAIRHWSPRPAVMVFRR